MRHVRVRVVEDDERLVPLGPDLEDIVSVLG
jgi:hypothetical protein